MVSLLTQNQVAKGGFTVVGFLTSVLVWEERLWVQIWAGEANSARISALPDKYYLSADPEYRG